MTTAVANLQSMRAAQQNLAASTGTSNAFGGKELLKMDRATGDWVFGQEALDLGDSQIAVNPASFQHGIVAWENSKIQGEVMVSVSQPAPRAGEQPDPNLDWRDQVSFEAAIVDGPDAGTQLLFKSSSLGGKNMVSDLFNVICDQIDADVSKPVPVVELTSSHYKHKSYGRVNTPQYELKSWQAIDSAEPEEPAEEEKPTRRRTRRA